MEKINLLTDKDFEKSTWSGGETTQVCLFPPEGRYQLSEFDFRISTATVSLEQSTFSLLPGYRRIILSLDHPVTLTHKNLLSGEKRVVRLAPFETDFFDGSEETTSEGRCRDFNLIYTDQYSGTMEAVFANEKREIPANCYYCLYFLSDCELEVSGFGQSQISQCEQGQAFVIESRSAESGYVWMKQHSFVRTPIAVEVTVKRK